MNLAEAKLNNLDVVCMVPPDREDIRKIVVEAYRNVGREVIEFTEDLGHGESLLCAVAGPRRKGI